MDCNPYKNKWNIILEAMCSKTLGVSSSINVALWFYVLQYKLIILFQISTIVKRNPPYLFYMYKSINTYYFISTNLSHNLHLCILCYMYIYSRSLGQYTFLRYDRETVYIRLCLIKRFNKQTVYIFCFILFCVLQNLIFLGLLYILALSVPEKDHFRNCFTCFYMDFNLFSINMLALLFI
jgi:hypothetical protein